MIVGSASVNSENIKNDNKIMIELENQINEDILEY